MSIESKETSEGVLNGFGGILESTQPNISVSSESVHSVFKAEDHEPEENEEQESESCVLPAPRVGIRVKKELTAFDSNIGESLDTSDPEPEKHQNNADMVQFPTAWPCPTCGFVYMSIQELQRHQPSCRHTLTRPHLCNICTESFERKSDLNNHLVCHQTNRPHACRVCGNLHRTKAELMTHMLTHQVDKPHKCTTCGQEFQRHSSLTNHMKIHSYAAGRALIPPLFSPIKPTSSLSSMISPVKRNQSSLQQDRSTEPIPSFETLPVPGYSFYNSLLSSSNYASFLANKIMNNGGPSSKLGDQIMSSLLPPQLDPQNSFACSSVSTTQITCLPDIGQPPDGDTTEDIPSDLQLPQQAFIIHEQNQFDNVPDAETSDADRALNNYLSVKNAGLLFGIKVEEQFNPELNTSQHSLESPDDDTALDESHTDELLHDMQDSGDEKSAPTDPRLTKESSIDASKPHMCQFCGIHFARLKAYQSHMKLHNDNWETGYQCQVCGQKFPDYVALSVHALKCMRGSRRDDDFTLPIREIPSMPSNETISAKAAAVNKQTFKHVCASCDKRFATKQKLFRHMWIHRKKVFPCEACSEVYEERELLDKHRLEAHPPNETTPYACTVCGKSFTSRQTLWEHGRVHGGTGSGAALLWCHECNKSFASRQGYQIHTRTHTGERPYGCRYCMKSFRDGGTLRKHERIHTGERPHACPICSRAFNQKVVLREHVRWVHAATTIGEPPLPCCICNTILPDREALCAHIVKHSDDMASEARAAKMSNSPATPRRAPRRCRKVLVQGSVAQRAPPLPSATTTSGDSMDESTPGSPYDFPKVEPRASRQSPSKDDSSAEDRDENMPIPSFSEIAPSAAQVLRFEETAPNVSVADIPDSEYDFMNQDISLTGTSIETDMVDPMAYMQVVTDVSPHSQDVLNREEDQKEGTKD